MFHFFHKSGAFRYHSISQSDARYQRTVPAARHIAQNSVERAALARRVRRYPRFFVESRGYRTAGKGPKEGILLAEVRRYDDEAALEVADLVDQQIRALAVRIVGYHDAMAILLLQLLEDLERFRARGGAHVQNNVVFLDVEEHRRKHADGFLATDVAG